jgi:hypothetical protein
MCFTVVVYSGSYKLNVYALYFFYSFGWTDPCTAMLLAGVVCILLCPLQWVSIGTKLFQCVLLFHTEDGELLPCALFPIANGCVFFWTGVK